MKPEHIKLLELAEKATQGEWLRDWDSECTVSESGDEAYSAWEVAGPAHVPSSRWLSSNLNKSKEDADYIVAAQPRVVKGLILELEAVTAENDDLRAQCGGMQMDIDELRAEVEASDWVPLTKATPPDGVPVLRWPGWAAEFSIDEWCNDYGCFLMSIEEGERATHWKPLGAPEAAMAAKELLK